LDIALGLALIFDISRMADEFLFAISSTEHHRVLAAMAYDAVALPAIICTSRLAATGGEACAHNLYLMIVMVRGGLWHGAG
jgi:hypothetical protein